MELRELEDKSVTSRVKLSVFVPEVHWKRMLLWESETGSPSVHSDRFSGNTNVPATGGSESGCGSGSGAGLSDPQAVIATNIKTCESNLVALIE